MSFFRIRYIPTSLAEHIYHGFLPVQSRANLASSSQKAFVISNASIITPSQHFCHKEAVFLILYGNIFIPCNKIFTHNLSFTPVPSRPSPVSQCNHRLPWYTVRTTHKTLLFPVGQSDCDPAPPE